MDSWTDVSDLKAFAESDGEPGNDGSGNDTLGSDVPEISAVAEWEYSDLPAPPAPVLSLPLPLLPPPPVFVDGIQLGAFDRQLYSHSELEVNSILH